MTAITILNLFLLPSLVTILVAGAVMNYRYIEKNIYQTYLISTLLFWAVVMIFVYAKFFADGGPTISYITEVCSVQMLFLGVPCFFTLVCYPVVILNANFLGVTNWVKRVSPLIAAFVAYFAYHIIASKEPFVRYATFGDLISNITSVSVILRLLIAALLVYTSVGDMVRIWKVVPLYNQYIEDNFADSSYNVGWIRKLILFTAATTSIYFVVLFCGSVYVNCLYILSLISLFTYIVHMSLLHRTSELITRLIVKRDPKRRGQYIVEEINSEVLDSKDCATEVTLNQINQWMNSSTPYIRIDFTTADIVNEFPSLEHQDLSMLFRSYGETFQSYVRRFRIIRACEIINDESGKVYTKQVFGLVGFSHQSSFSRSFISLVGVSPTEYSKLTKNEKAAIMSELSHFEQITPPPRRHKR